MHQRSRNSRGAYLAETNSFAGQFLHQTPVQSSRSIQHMQTSPGFPNPISSLNNFDIGQVFASQIKKIRRSLSWWNQLLCRSVLTPNSCTKFKIHSVHADYPGFPNPISSLINFDIGPVFASQIKKLRKSFTWWNQLLCRSVLTPNSCTKFKIHSAHADYPGFPNPISSLNNFDIGQVFASEIKKLKRSITWWNQLLLQVSSYTKLLYKVQDPFSTCRLSRVSKSNFQPDQFWYRTSLCLTDQKTQEELYMVEPTPLQVSSYTKFLYKVQDPFHACRLSRVSKSNF